MAEMTKDVHLESGRWLQRNGEIATVGQRMCSIPGYPWSGTGGDGEYATWTDDGMRVISAPSEFDLVELLPSHKEENANLRAQLKARDERIEALEKAIRKHRTSSLAVLRGYGLPDEFQTPVDAELWSVLQPAEVKG